MNELVTISGVRGYVDEIETDSLERRRGKWMA